MIRIDLGSDELKRAPKGNVFSELASKIRLPGRGSGADLGVPRPRRNFLESIGNLGATLVLFASVAGAYVPHFAFEQYKEYLINEHETAKKELEEKVALISKEVAKLTPFQKELESYEKQKELVRGRIDIIRGLLNQRGTPVNVLDAIGQSLPQRAWITNLDFDMKTARPAVNVSGQAFSNEDVSDYVDKLTESVFLQEVTLEGVTAAKALSGAYDVKTFQVAILPKGLRGTASVAFGTGTPAKKGAK